MAKLLLHPVRLRIVRAVFDGGDFTAADLIRRLPDVSQATLYRQLAELVRGGLVDTVSEERVRGAVRRTYRLDGHRPLLSDDDVSALAPARHQELLSMLTGAMVSEFDRYLGQPDADPASISYREFSLRLTPEQRDRFNRDLLEVVERYGERGVADGVPDSPGSPHRLTVVLVPQLEP